MPVFLILAAAATEAATDAHGEASAAASLPQLDPTWWPSQLFWLAFTFGILYWLMAGRFLPALGRAIETRRDRIADDLDQASEFKRQAEEAENAYDRALADAKAKAQTIAAETRAKVDEELAALQSETNAAVEKQISAAEARITEMKNTATAKVREAAGGVAGSLVEILIDETPTGDAVSKALQSVKRT